MSSLQTFEFRESLLQTFEFIVSSLEQLILTVIIPNI